MAIRVHAPFDTLQERIRLRAYHLYELRAREGHPGDALDDWLRAESELLAIGKPHGADEGDDGAVRMDVKPASTAPPKRAAAAMSRR